MAAPPGLKVRAEHPQGKQVENDVKEARMKKEVGDRLPHIEIVGDIVRPETEPGEGRRPTEDLRGQVGQEKGR